jgi:hypothetical protein
VKVSVVQTDSYSWYCREGETLAMTVGVGHSGGGITGILCALCAQHALRRQHDPSAVDAATVSTASGGTLGYLIHQSVLAEDEGGPLEFPLALSGNVTYSQLASRKVRQSGHLWWGRAIDFLPNSAATIIAQRATRRLDDSKGWWQDTVGALFSVDYRIKPATVGAARGVHRLLINAALLEASACPIKRNGSSGCMVDAKQSLRHVVATASAARGNGANITALNITGGVVLAADAFPDGALIAAAWSSAFYAAAIVESRAAYEAERALETLDKGVLISANAVGPAARTVHLLDGGLVDTTGAVALLQRRATRILLLYDNNDALAPAGAGDKNQSEAASLAYLFGVPTPTDTMNSLAGPELTQVFDAALWPSVYANLTDGSVLRARLTGVAVRPNAYLGVESFVVDELIILSNENSEAFLSSFVDPAVRAHLSPEWPNRFPIGMSAFDANLLCEFERWKLARYRDEISSLLTSA